MIHTVALIAVGVRMKTGDSSIEQKKSPNQGNSDPAFADNGTRGRVLQAALEQFAQSGFESASVREITAAAQANLAAINYHFGTKEALYHAVVSETFNSIAKQRLQLLAECAALPDSHPELLERVLTAMIAPHVGLIASSNGRYYIKLLARLLNEPRDITRRVYLDDIHPVRRQFLRALRRALPRLSDENLYRAFSHATVLMVTAIDDIGYETMAGKPAWPENADVFTAHLVRFLAAGFRALE